MGVFINQFHQCEIHLVATPYVMLSSIFIQVQRSILKTSVWIMKMENSDINKENKTVHNLIENVYASIQIKYQHT